MSDKTRHKHKPRKKDRPPRPAVDTLTVIWGTTLTTAVIAEAASFGIRSYVTFANPQAKLLNMLSAYLLGTAALVGAFLIILTPIVVRRKVSNPPFGVVLAAYIVGAIPWLAMILQGMSR
jgi:hypothetical protein